MSEEKPETIETTPEPVAPAASGESKKAANPLKDFDPSLLVDLYDRLLGKIRPMLSVSLFVTLRTLMIKVGHLGLLLALVGVLFYSLVIAIKGTPSALLTGLAAVLMITVLQFSAAKFMHSGASLIESSPSRLGTAGLLDVFGLLGIILAIVVVILSLVGIPTLGLISVLCGLASAVGLLLFSWISLNPSLTSTGIEEGTSAGEEAIGILAFILKGVLAIVPLLFGVLCALGAIGILVATFQLIFAGSDYGKVMSASIAYETSRMMVVGGALLPLGAFIGFLLQYLVIDLVRAILSLQDTAAKKKRTK